MADYTLPGLPYDHGALDPHIGGEIMELHHSQHHKTYVTTLNGVIDQLAEARANDGCRGAPPDRGWITSDPAPPRGRDHRDHRVAPDRRSGRRPHPHPARRGRAAGPPARGARPARADRPVAPAVGAAASCGEPVRYLDDFAGGAGHPIAAASGIAAELDA